MNRADEHKIKIGLLMASYGLSEAQAEVLIMALGYGLAWKFRENVLWLYLTDPCQAMSAIVAGFMQRAEKFIPKTRQYIRYLHHAETWAMLFHDPKKEVLQDATNPG